MPDGEIAEGEYRETTGCQLTTRASPARLLEILSGRFGALEAVAYSSIKLSRYVSECEMSMDLRVAEAVLEFGEDLRNAQEAAGEWTDEILS